VGQPPIEVLDEGTAARARGPLVALLQDAVDSGASIGFLPPLSAADAAAYWDSVVAGIREGSRVLLVGRDDAGGVVGSAQLELATRANAVHRAEVSKVMVHRAARRRGLGRALMLAAEGEARRRGRTTLILDTRQGDPSEALYRSCGWTLAGAIPRYARSADGTLHATAVYYRLLDPA
jgi:GNAT superfamily N-acetyltransferase